MSQSAFEGEVELVREGRPITLILNMAIVTKDSIRVEVGMAEITYDDGSTITIKPHTDVTLDQLKKRKKWIWSKIYLSRLVNIFKGTVLGVIKERKDLVTEFETPALVAAVRGTKIEVNHKTGSEISDVYVAEGIVTITLPDGSEFELDPGDGIRVTYNPDTGLLTVEVISGEVELPFKEKYLPEKPKLKKEELIEVSPYR